MTSNNLRTENHFDYVKISIAFIKNNGLGSKNTKCQVVGEVTKPETINYRTLKPEMDGLFVKDFWTFQRLGCRVESTKG